MTTRSIDLNLNETGFLCNLITNAIIRVAPPTADGSVEMPFWLGELFMKLAQANDQMMAEESIKAARIAPEPPFTFSPTNARKH